MLIIAVASITITLIVTSKGAGNGSAQSIVEFQKYVASEYGVKPEISVEVKGVSKSKAKAITESLEGKLGTGKPTPVDFEGDKWYSTKSNDGKLWIVAHYK